MFTRIPHRLRITDELKEMFDEEVLVLMETPRDELVVERKGNGTARIEFSSNRTLGVGLGTWKPGDQFDGFLKGGGRFVDILITMLE